jgi:DHA1 family bicyclomycin/chloramphenicol resistance-like MFS transporter
MIVLLGALTAFSAVSIDLYLPGLPSVASSLGATATQAELTVAAFFVGISVGQLIYGPLADRVGRRAPLLAGIAIYVAASVGCALAPNIETLIGFRLVQALGGCSGVVLARAVVRDRFPPQQTAQIFSTLMLVMGLAPILAPMLGAAILSVAGWRTTFWLLTGFGVACGVATLFALAESRPEHVAAHAKTESPIGAYLGLLRQPRLMGYVLYGACSSAALLTYVTTSPDVLMGVFHVPPQHFAWMFGLNGAGLIAASQINGRLLRYHTFDTVLRWANLGAVAAGVLLVVMTVTGWFGLYGVLVGLFLVMSSFGFNMANAMAGAMSVDPKRGGTTAGLAGSAQFGAGFLAASLAGALHDGTARPTAFVILGSMVLGAAVLHGLALKKPPQV